jgi:hypothetical protein
MERKLIVLILSAFLLIQCKLENKQTEPTSDNNTENYHNKEEEIFLDNGKKWKVPSAMHAIISEMQHLMLNESFKENNMAAHSLNELITQLTSSCTMQGQGHDELHKILLPLIEEVENFQEFSEFEIDDSTTEILRLLNLYNDFFESE